jgi:hypothetical protein
VEGGLKKGLGLGEGGAVGELRSGTALGEAMADGHGPWRASSLQNCKMQTHHRLPQPIQPPPSAPPNPSSPTVLEGMGHRGGGRT